MQKELEQIEFLKDIIFKIKSVKITPYKEEKIIDAIDCVISMIKTEIVEKLGNEAFEKLIKKGG